MKRNLGYTLIEILTAIVIVTILVAMAVPLYEKTMERSRLAEVRATLAKLLDAKLYAMDNMGCASFSTTSNLCPKLQHLNVAFDAKSVSENGLSFNTRDFHYSIATGQGNNGVCARRLGGDYAGKVVFTYDINVLTDEPKFACNNALDGNACKTGYGLEGDQIIGGLSLCN